MAREFLRLTKEQTYGTFDAAAASSDIVQIDLTGDNAFTMRPRPRMWSIRSAAGNSVRRLTGSSQMEVGGRLTTLLFPSQQSLLLPWGCSPSGTPNDLFSVTADHGVLLEDGTTIKRRRYLGTKVRTIEVGAEAGTADGNLVRVTYELVAQQPASPDPDATAFPAPQLTDYPTDAPYVFQHASGGFKVASTRSEYDRISIRITNNLHVPFHGGQYITRCRYKGRDVNFTFHNLYLAVTDRVAYEAITAQDAEVLFTNGAHTAKFDFNTKNYFVDGIEDDLPLSSGYYQSLSLQAYLDAAAGSDFALTLV